MEIQVKSNNIDYSLKILKKKLHREGIFKVLKKKKQYEKQKIRRKKVRREREGIRTLVTY